MKYIYYIPYKRDDLQSRAFPRMHFATYEAGGKILRSDPIFPEALMQKRHWPT